MFTKTNVQRYHVQQFFGKIVLPFLGGTVFCRFFNLHMSAPFDSLRTIHIHIHIYSYTYSAENVWRNEEKRLRMRHLRQNWILSDSSFFRKENPSMIRLFKRTAIKPWFDAIKTKQKIMSTPAKKVTLLKFVYFLLLFSQQIWILCNEMCFLRIYWLFWFV